MTTDPWWLSATIYQIWPRSFSDGNGDGIGDLAGIVDHLDHLVDLGVDAVWLSPIYPSPQDDAGYDISDYRGIDPLFGTLDEFDALVAAVHERGMKLIMDLVVNHTSDEHEWFVESRGSERAAKRDWYWWRPPRDGMTGGEPGAEPNNWRSMFGGSAWTYDAPTGEYYLHLFSVKQPDLNWEQPDVRSAVHSMMRWWLDRGIDGFRMDVINFISKDVELPDGRVSASGRYGNGMPYFIDGPRIHEFLREMREAVAPGRDDLIFVGEMPGVSVDEALRYTARDRNEVDMVFQFEHVGLDHGRRGRFDLRDLRLTDLKASLGRWQDGLAASGWNSLYWCNHDQPRIVSRFGDDRHDTHGGEYRVRSAKMLATVLHLHRGTPFVYQGEELGMTNYPFSSLDEVRDIEALNHAAETLADGVSMDDVLEQLRHGARDNARTPMQWNDSDHAGFTDVQPWMPVNPNHVEINAATQRDDPDSVFHHYRRLIALRHSLSVVVDGRFEMLLADDEQVYAFTRSLEDDHLLVLGNFSGVVADVEMPDAGGWAGADLVISNVDEPFEVATSDRVRLQPWEATVLRRTAANVGG
ncbi:MAG: alpha-glucosidase [Ilumatobacter sp.]|uniref:glycoside hydrolase family 13 protein n=1 Tax=Ilumatobacter sp. TaxID=1967498 RepID=UPI003C7314DC